MFLQGWCRWVSQLHLKVAFQSRSLGFEFWVVCVVCSPSPSPQVFMEQMGSDKQGQMIVYHLIDLLKKGYRLPTPQGCPREVRTGLICSSYLYWDQILPLLRSDTDIDEQPCLCLVQIQQLMSECWSSDVTLRPSFKDLSQSVDTIWDGKEGWETSGSVSCTKENRTPRPVLEALKRNVLELRQGNQCS